MTHDTIPSSRSIDRSLARRVHDAVEAEDRDDARQLVADAVPEAPEPFVAALVADMGVFVADAPTVGADPVDVVHEMLEEFADEEGA